MQILARDLMKQAAYTEKQKRDAFEWLRRAALQGHNAAVVAVVAWAAEAEARKAADAEAARLAHANRVQAEEILSLRARLSERNRESDMSDYMDWLSLRSEGQALDAFREIERLRARLAEAERLLRGADVYHDSEENCAACEWEEAVAAFLRASDSATPPTAVQP